MKPTQIAAQLYTCRELLKTPPEIATTLRRVREAGYTAVQISGIGPIPEEELNTILDGEGLTCCATHESGADILDNTDKVIDRLAKLRCKYTAYPFPASVDLSDEAIVDAWIEKLDAAGAKMAAAGQVLCYHNHHHEFRKVGGITILERIYAQSNPRNLQGEPDTYWVQFGGSDNLEWCERLSGRLPLIHLKDYMITEENTPTYCEVGAGNLNFHKIIPAAEKAGCEWFIVEQDTCPGDPVDSLAQSYRFLVENICS